MTSFKFTYQSSGKLRRVDKNFQFYVLGGVLTLLAFIFIVAAIGQKTKEFDSLVEEKIERIYRQIGDEKYAEVYTESGRQLIARFDQSEFEALLRAARPQVAGKVKKNCASKYSDMVQRLRRNLFLSFQLATVCRLENDEGKSVQYLDWRIRGGQIDLIWFEVGKPR